MRRTTSLWCVGQWAIGGQVRGVHSWIMGSWPPNVTTRNLMYGGQSLSRTGQVTTRLAHLLHWQLLRRLQRHHRPQNGFFCFSSRRGRKKGFSGRGTAGSISSSGCHPRRHHQPRPLRARSGERPQRYLADFSISLLPYSPATLRGPERVHRLGPGQGKIPHCRRGRIYSAV